MYYKQETDWSCGASALRNALSNFGFEYNEKFLIELLNTDNKRGTWSFNFKNLKTISNLQLFETENCFIKDIISLIDKGFQVITGFYVKDGKVDHYTLIKEIKEKNVVFQDSWFGDNYLLDIEEFYKIWHLDPKYENKKRWIFAIKYK